MWKYCQVDCYQFTMALNEEIVTHYNNRHIGATSNQRATNTDVGSHVFPYSYIFHYLDCIDRSIDFLEAIKVYYSLVDLKYVSRFWFMSVQLII